MTREELRKYEWGHLHHDERIIYIKLFWSTSVVQALAEIFSATEPSSDKIRVLMIFNFPEPCDIAIRLYRISDEVPCIS